VTEPPQPQPIAPVSMPAVAAPVSAMSASVVQPALRACSSAALRCSTIGTAPSSYHLRVLAGLQTRRRHAARCGHIPGIIAAAYRGGPCKLGSIPGRSLR
jgi:hypothetical protein